MVPKGRAAVYDAGIWVWQGRQDGSQETLAGGAGNTRAVQDTR